MEHSKYAHRELTHQFFRHYPDYEFCRTLADNIQNGVTTRVEALEILGRKARAAAEHGAAIEEKLNLRTVDVGGRSTRLTDLGLRRLLELEDEVLAEVARFYLKHPFAHGRTRRSRLWPRWFRTLFLGALFGHARGRNLDLDYEACFDLLRLL